MHASKAGFRFSFQVLFCLPAPSIFAVMKTETAKQCIINNFFVLVGSIVCIFSSVPVWGEKRGIR